MKSAKKPPGFQVPVDIVDGFQGQSCSKLSKPKNNPSHSPSMTGGVIQNIIPLLGLYPIKLLLGMVDCIGFSTLSIKVV